MYLKQLIIKNKKCNVGKKIILVFLSIVSSYRSFVVLSYFVSSEHEFPFNCLLIVNIARFNQKSTVSGLLLVRNECLNGRLLVF